MLRGEGEAVYDKRKCQMCNVANVYKQVSYRYTSDSKKKNQDRQAIAIVVMKIFVTEGHWNYKHRKY